MPHKNQVPALCEVDEHGGIVYPPTSPAETPGSRAFGSPMKGGDPWTSKRSRAVDVSSTQGPSRTRQRHRNQQPKMPFDAGADDIQGSKQGDEKRIPPLATTFVSAPFNDAEVFAESTPVKAPVRRRAKMDDSSPVPPRSELNASSLAPDENKDQYSISDADKSPTPKPSRPITSRTRKMSDTNNTTASPELGRVASSRPRKMSDASTVDKPHREKTKGMIDCSSAPPSVTDSIEDEPLQDISCKSRGKSAMASRTENQVKKSVDRRNSAPKPKNKVRLSALDLEGGEEIDGQSNDPFDQANIPSSRDVSPKPSKRKTKKPPRNQPTAKPSKSEHSTKKPLSRDDKAAAGSNKPSPREKQSARPRQKAKPSAADFLQQSIVSVSNEDRGNNGCIPEKPNRHVSGHSQANKASAEAPALTRTAKVTQKRLHAPQKDLVSISSNTDSEQPDTDEVDDDEYVDSAGPKIVKGIRQPPKTINTTSAFRAPNGMALNQTPNDLCASGNGLEKATEVEDIDASATGLASAPLFQNSTKNNTAQAPVPKAEPAVESQPKKKSTVTMAHPPPPKGAIPIQKLRCGPQNRSSIDKNDNNLSVPTSISRQVKQTTTTFQSQGMPQATNGNRKDFAPADTRPSEPQNQQIRVDCQSRANQPQVDLGPSKSNTAHNKKQSKLTESVMEHSPEASHDTREQYEDEVKNRDRKASCIAFGADEPQNKRKLKQKPSANGHRLEQKNPGISPDSNMVKATKPEHSPTGDIGHVQENNQIEAQSTPSTEVPLLQRCQIQQPFSQVKHRAPVVDPDVALSPLTEKELAHGSRISQDHSTILVPKPLTSLEENSKEKCFHPPRSPNGNQIATTQTNPGTDTNGDQYPDANDMDVLQFGDEPVDSLAELLIPGSLEQPHVIENSASVSQLEDATVITDLLDQGRRANGSSRKRRRPDDSTSQVALPIHEQIDSQKAFNQQIMMEPEPFRHQTEFDGQIAVHQQHGINHHTAMKQQPSMIMNQPIETQPHSTKLQQPIIVKQTMKNEQRELNQLTRNSKAPIGRDAEYIQPSTFNRLVQPAISKGSAKASFPILATQLQRRSKRAKLDAAEPNLKSPLPTANPKFCVPANGYSSDDVFAPVECNDKIEIDSGVVNRLRGIGLVKNTGPENQKLKAGQLPKGFEVPQQRLNTRIPVKPYLSHPMQRSSPGPSQDESPVQTSESDLWRRMLTHRQTQASLFDMKHKEKVEDKDPETYEDTAEVMHRIVAVSSSIVKTPSRFH